MAGRIGLRAAAAWVRPARLEDLAAIQTIEAAVFDCDQLSRRSLRYYQKSATASLLVLEQVPTGFSQSYDQDYARAFEAGAVSCAPGAGSRIMGYSLISFRQGSKRARLFSIAIDPLEQGRGLGRLLLAASERIAKSRGALAMRLEARMDNAPALSLYAETGYRRFAMIEDFYEDGAAALRLEKDLAQKTLGRPAHKRGAVLSRARSKPSMS